MIKKIWKDVCIRIISIVISTSIISIAGAVLTKTENVSFYDAIFNFWKIEIRITIWWIAVIMLVTIIVVLLIKSKKQFLNYTEDEWNGMKFRWDWRYDKKRKKYIIEHIDRFCPNCKTGILTPNSIYSDKYKCTKCEYSVLFQQLDGIYSYSQVITSIRNKISIDSKKQMKYIYFDW